MNRLKKRISLGGYGLVCLFIAGCGSQEQGADGLTRFVLQTDWFAQPEHGGFYYALAAGYYEEAGLEVTILQGGPNANSLEKVLTGRADVAMNRMDNLLRFRRNGVPVVALFSVLQHDPQALLLHADNPIQSFAELDGATVQVVPGQAWTEYLEQRYQIDLEVVAHDFGLERFVANPEAIIQCLETNEPYYLELQGVAVKTLPVRSSGYDPYHVVYSSEETLAAKSEVLRRFTEASVRGWRDYLQKDPTPAHTLIAEVNPNMTEEFMQWGRQQLIEQGFVFGNDKDPNDMGLIVPERVAELQQTLLQLHVLEAPVDLQALLQPTTP